MTRSIEAIVIRMVASLGRRVESAPAPIADILDDLDERLLVDLGVMRSGAPLPAETVRPAQRRGVGRQSGGAISKPEKSKPGETVQLTSVQAPRLVAVCQ